MANTAKFVLKGDLVASLARLPTLEESYIRPDLSIARFKPRKIAENRIRDVAARQDPQRKRGRP